ncbi:MAG: enoyl-CoA hydratase/isomerase family protein [Gammaproteobacteria bacterium]|nr:enoyl-CoA hydratase/isomerase family protein [Gammaproteobacteria bacterium]
MLILKTLDVFPQTDHTLIVRFNRPAVRHAINLEMMRELKQLWESIPTAYPEARSVILTGSNQAFCAGADLKERLGMSLTVWRDQYQVLTQALDAMLQFPLPLIAAVNGYAFGGGLELALACDFIYASEQASFAQSEVKLGLMPGAGGTQNLPRASGLRRAKELAFTAQIFTAHEAYTYGIVNQVVPHDELMTQCLAVAAHINTNAPLAVQQVKRTMNATQALSLISGLQFERKTYDALLETSDRLEGIAAFNEKRQPQFTGKS